MYHLTIDTENPKLIRILSNICEFEDQLDKIHLSIEQPMPAAPAQEEPEEELQEAPKTEEPAEPVRNASETPVEQPAEPQPSKTQGVGAEAVRAALNELRKKHGIDAVKAIFAKYGVANFTQLTEAQYAEVLGEATHAAN